jgi:carboxyl-terminal processing protease
MLRANEKALLDFTIVRGKIPLHSIDASYLIDEKTGYIKINRFSSTTYNEFHKALRILTDKKIERLVDGLASESLVVTCKQQPKLPMSY